ncbi:MAG: hypothetical protein PUC14_07580 [Bacteroidales bacterium]|nr:hypothetical protein [Bacteroidales bacterium]
MKRYLCYILLQILCICLLPTKGQSTNADVVVCKNPNASSYTSSFTYQAFSPIDIQAPTVNGTLGGSYANDYLYDKQYRLIQSDGNGGFVYTFKASYSPTGRMSSKSMMANNLVVNLRFGYDRKSFTHQPRTIYDPTEGTMECYWDANGNLSQIIGCKSNKARLHDWDEENRLRFVLGEKYAGYYGYDATLLPRKAIPSTIMPERNE